MKRILTVDDSEPMRKMLGIVLKAGGYDVVSAGDGAEGLQLFQNSPVDLIITDINMPVMDGIEFIRQIRLVSPDVPIVALTTESEDAMRRRGHEAGANGWVVKPFKPQPLLDYLRQLLR